VWAGWRGYGGAVALFSGLNLWLCLLCLPILFAGAPALPMTVALVPLGVLALGLVLTSDTFLLLAYPTSLLIPVAMAPAVVSDHMQNAWRFAAAAAAFLLYMFTVSAWQGTRPISPPPPARLLSSAKAPPSRLWQRRFRVYYGLLVASVVFPAVLLWMVNFDSATAEFVKKTYPGRVSSIRVLGNLLCLFLWTLLYHSVWLGIFKPHRTGDADLVTELSVMARGLTRGPRREFYLSIVLAALFIGLALLWRLWGDFG
jgi:hypothetical protein